MNGLIGTSQSNPLAKRDFERESRGMGGFDPKAFGNTLEREMRDIQMGKQLDTASKIGFGPSMERQIEMGSRDPREQLFMDQMRASSEGLKLDEKDKNELKDKVAEFVAIAFLNPLMKMARDNRDSDGLFGGGAGEKVFGAQMDQQIAMQTAKNGDFGLVDIIYKQLTGNLTGEGVDRRA